MLRKIFRLFVISVGVLALGIAALAFFSVSAAQREKTLAEERGFESVSQMKAAETAGFDTGEEYREHLADMQAQREAEAERLALEELEAAAEIEAERLSILAESSGFNSVDAMLDARERGFFDAAEEKAAADAGFSTREEFLRGPTLLCENTRGERIYISHSNGFATIVRPLDNPIDGYRQTARNVRITTDNESMTTYDGEDLTKGLNLRTNRLFRGFRTAQFDKRQAIFTVSSEMRLLTSDDWGSRNDGGIYNCQEIPFAEFDLVAQ